MPVTYEVLEGIVQQQGKDDSGFKLLERWCNYDMRYDGRHARPGERVKIRLRNGRYIVHLVDEGQELPPEPKPSAARAGAYRSPEEERRIVRQASLKAAIAWLGTFAAETELADGARRPKSDDVLKLAEKFETWVYR